MAGVRVTEGDDFGCNPKDTFLGVRSIGHNGAYVGVDKVGWSNTFFWKVNQWVMIHMFHCRMILTYHMWWVCISNWNAVVENLGLLHFAIVFIGLSAVTVVLNPYWMYKKTHQLISPTDWNITDGTMKNGSSKKLNQETFQKKGL